VERHAIPAYVCHPRHNGREVTPALALGVEVGESRIIAKDAQRNGIQHLGREATIFHIPGDPFAVCGRLLPELFQPCPPQGCVPTSD
jgi:hypothetical protein